jgi:2'-5' RNA ligase
MRTRETLAEFAIPEVPAADLISGFVALVIQPDAATIRVSYDLAATLLPERPEQAVAPGSLPHLTLTQCAVRGAPRERAAEFVDRLEDVLHGLTLPLRTVTPFGGGFLFWCVDPAAPARATLQRAHADALTLAEGLLDPVANAAVVEGTIAATNGDPVLVEQARRWGYAMAGDRYLPHITLGFDRRLAVARDGVSSFAPREHAQATTVERVVLAKLGSLGRVDHVFSL